MTHFTDVSFVAFDFDGTLTDFVAADLAALEALRQAACEAADPGEFVERAVDEIMAFHERVEAGQSDPLDMDAERLTRTLAAYGVNCAEAHLQLYSSAVLKATVPKAGALKLLAELQTRRLRLALLSNAYNGQMQRQRVRHCFADQPFEVIVIAGETSALKPAPEPFQVMLDALQLPASAGVYVGDSVQHDVAGALGVGLRAILVHPHSRAQEQALTRGASAAVSDLRELLTV